MKYDFAGWATRNNIRCSDGRTILKDAFKEQDGATVPLVWNHSHNDPENILGKALLHNCDEGVRVEGFFNDSSAAKQAKLLLRHGDINALSIHANQLKQSGGDVYHGVIREVSLVLAGANPAAYIDEVIMHSSDECMTDVEIWTGEEIEFISHADVEDDEKKEKEDMEEKKETNDETIQDIVDSMNEKQKNVMYFLVGEALKGENEEESEEEDINMKHNVFEGAEEVNNETVLTHSDEMSILELAKQKGVGSLKDAVELYFEDESNSELSHGFEQISKLFSDYKTIPNNGEPYTITRDYSWVDKVINGASKSPISRVRTRQADARDTKLRGLGYKTGNKKKDMSTIKLLKRTTDPQTIYIRDSLHRDDIIDITDFDVVSYQYKIMEGFLKEELALAAMIGDGRDEVDEDKIHEDHIRPILKDEELYAIHKDVDIATAKEKLQGTNTSQHFGDNYVYAEAIVEATLDARLEYKAPGTPTLFCSPKLLNKMLLARDLNGRRIYSSKQDVATALLVDEIVTVEQFEGVTRKAADNKNHNLLGIMVNLSNYQFGAAKGGEITKFDDFDIDFNQYKYLIETRLSGALTEVKSAIVLEEPAAGTVTE